MKRMTQPHAVQQVAEALAGTTAGGERQPQAVLEPATRAIQPPLTAERSQDPLAELADLRLARTCPLKPGDSPHH